MEVHRKLVTAIEGFDRWNRPWDFLAQVSSLLAPDARGELERIWTTANETAGWSIGNDLARGGTLADARLSLGYP